jgi:hypothetical protein
MMQRSTRRNRVSSLAALALALPALHACYEYKPLITAAPPAGESIALQISDQGRTNLSERFGPGLAEIQGRVVSVEGSDYVVNVFRVSHIDGESAAWAGEVTRINRSFVGTVKGRQFSPLRTGLLGAVGIAGAYFLVSRGLSGGFSGGHSDDPTDQPATIRIPLGFRF